MKDKVCAFYKIYETVFKDKVITNIDSFSSHTPIGSGSVQHTIYTTVCFLLTVVQKQMAGDSKVVETN